MMKWWMMFFIACTAGVVQARPEGIQTTKPVRRDFLQRVHWFGTVVNRGRVDVVVLEPGRVISIKADDGDAVAKGALLMEMGGPRMESRLAALRERVAGLKQQATQADKVVELQRKAVEQKLAKYEVLAAAESERARLEAEYGSAKQELARLEAATQIRAPVSGIVTARAAAVGQNIQMGDPLLSILPASSCRIKATLFPPTGTVLKDRSVEVLLPHGKIVKGMVVGILPELTAEGATVVWIETKNAPLPSGQRIAGTLLLSEHRQVLAVPQDAVMRDDAGRAFLFLKTGDGYEKRAVETGLVSKDWIEITNGLSPSDEVVVQGVYELFHSDFNKIYKVVD